jgi:glycosyltransferase involved in cell wall biosynthesis
MDEMNDGKMTPTGHDLAIVIPAYDEEHGVRATLMNLRTALPDSEVIVIDDGSRDGTAAAALSVPGVRVVRHAYNAGYGASIKTGVALATRKYIAWFDADGEHRVDDLVAMVDRIRRERLAAVLGHRRLRQSPFLRIAGKAVILALAHSLDVRQGSDLNCGLRVFRRDVLLHYLPLLPNGFSASLTSTTIMIERNYPMAFHPVTMGTRVGTSKVRMRDGFGTLMLVLRIVMLFAPLRIFLRLGVNVAAAGFIYGLVVSLVRRQGFPAAAVLGVVVGFLLCMLGLIADQISQLRMERLHSIPIALLEDNEDNIAMTGEVERSSR